MDLKINKNHAEQGRRQSPTSCPTVIALRAAGFTNLEVGVEKIRVYSCEVKADRLTTDERSLVRMIDMPQRLVDAIRRFDAGHDFEHGVYRIPGLSKPKGGSK